MSSRTSQWHSVSQVRGRGGKGRRLSPFPPAHRLIELHCAHRDYVLLLFPSRTYMFLPRVSRGVENSQRSFRPCDRERRDLYLPRPTRFHVTVISSRVFQQETTGSVSVVQAL